MALDRLDVFLEQVGGWEGYEVAQVTLEAELQPDAFGLPAPRIVIELQPKADAVGRCSRCGEAVAEIHDVSSRRVRDLPIMGRDTWLLVPRRRVECPRCGSPGVPILYGYPSDEMFEAADQGEVALGGCVIELDQPTHECPSGHRWVETQG